MSCRLLVIPALLLLNLAVAGQRDDTFDIQLIGTKPGEAEWQVGAERTGSGELRLMFQGTPNYPLWIRLICPASSRECLISKDTNPPSAAPIQIKDPAQEPGAPPDKSSGETPEKNLHESPLPVVTLTLAQLPVAADNTKKSRGLLIVTDGKHKSITKQLVFSFNTPSWKYPAGSTISEPLHLKVDLLGKGLVRIDTNEWKPDGKDKIGLKLSDFVNPNDGTAATVRILDGSGIALTQVASLNELGYKAGGDIELQLDAGALPVDQSYDGTLVFTKNGQPLGYPPLTLKITRVAPAAKATLVAYPPLAAPNLSTVSSVDVKLKERSGDLLLQDFQFYWSSIVKDDKREGPEIDRLELGLEVGLKTYRLWPDRDAGPIDIPQGETAILRLKYREGDWFGFGRYRLPLELWAANTGTENKTSITLDFDKRAPRWLPHVLLVFAVLALFAVNKFLRFRSEAASTKSRIERFDKRIAAIQEYCRLLPVSTLDAELERANLSMRPEWHHFRPWWSRSVNKKVKGQLDVLDKCIPTIEKLGYLWKQWSQSRSQVMVEHRAVGRLREIASHMAQEMAYVTSQNDPFSSWVTEGLDAMKEWTDREQLDKKYSGMVARRFCSLLRQPVTTSDTSTGLEKVTESSSIPLLTRLSAAPVRMRSPPDDGWAAVAKSLWDDSGQEDLTALKAALSEWEAVCRQERHRIDPGRIFAANRKVERELKKPLWSSFQNLFLPEPDPSESNDGSDSAASFWSWAEALGDSLRDFSTVIKNIDETTLSDYGLQRYLRHILRKNCKTPPSSFSDTLAVERGVYVPLKLIQEGRENRLGDDAIQSLHDKIRGKLSSFRDPTDVPAWDDSDLEELFTIVDVAAWNELQKRDPNNRDGQKGKLRIVVEAADEDGQIEAYQLVHCRIDPGDADSGFQLKNSHAFNAGFGYEWMIAPPKNAEDGYKEKGGGAGLHKAQSQVTQEPQVWIFAPWQGNCEVSVIVTPDGLRVDDATQIEVKQPLKVRKSGLHKEANRLVRRDLIFFGLAFLAAYGAGLGLQQFDEANYGSFTAWIVLFASALGSVKLADWLDKSDD